MKSIIGSILFAILTFCLAVPDGLPARAAHSKGTEGASMPEAELAWNGDAAHGKSAIASLAESLAARVAGYRQWRAGAVTTISRSGFRVNLGRAHGITKGLEAEVLRLSGSESVRVALAKVIDVDDDASLLRRTDRIRKLGVKEGDAVRIAVGEPRVLVGGIGGHVPGAVSESIGSHLLLALQSESAVTALRGPQLKPESPWPWRQASGLCDAAMERGCPLALAGWAERAGDSLHVVVGLIDALSRETLELYAGSTAVDDALAVIMSAGPAGDESPGPMATGDYASTAYDTGLRPALEFTVPMGAVAVQILSDMRAACVVGKTSVAIYKISPGSGRAHEEATLEIESPPGPVQCRDPAGTIALVDSDGDGLDEVVVWSSVLSGPAAFSVTGSEGGSVALERAETYWLPWADSPAASRYVQGTNHMVLPSSAGGTCFFSWRTADLDRDGASETVLTEPGGYMTARDSSMAVICKKAGVGAPLEIYDMNGDGAEEIIATSTGVPGEDDVVVFFNWSAGSFKETWRLERLRPGVVSVSAGHLDEDDLPDLVAVLRDGPRATESRVLVLLTGAR